MKNYSKKECYDVIGKIVFAELQQSALKNFDKIGRLNIKIRASWISFKEGACARC